MKRMQQLIGLAILVAGWSARAEFPWEGQKVQVASAAFDAAAYDLAKRELTLWFDNGAVYIYRDVPDSLYARFLEEEGKGRFFHRHIRGRFASECRQVAARAPIRPAVDHPVASPLICQRAARGGGS